jgi:hypothetical protein
MEEYCMSALLECFSGSLKMLNGEMGSNILEFYTNNFKRKES